MSDARWEALRQAVWALSERERLLLQLTRLDGLSAEDLALVLGCRRGQVQGELRDAESGLARRLKAAALRSKEA